MILFVFGLLLIIADATNRPIIGILAGPITQFPHGNGSVITDGRMCAIGFTNSVIPKATTNCFTAYYVKWIESAGARVAVIPYNADPTSLRALFNGVNGILFPGGNVDLEPTSSYYKTAKILYDWVLEEHDGGGYMPLWGTCMGFQLLALLTAQDDVLQRNAFDSEDFSLALDLTEDAAQSRFFSSLPPNVVSALSTKNVTENLHHDGVTPNSFETNQNLRKFYRVTSTNYDRKKKLFVSTIEGLHYPVYGTQWHPERPQFEWKFNQGLNHTLDAIISMFHTAEFFIKEAMQSNHSFPTAETEAAALIYNWNPVPGATNSYQIYYIDP